ncbi:hypothetical protein [Oerskovia jenensis]|uniref:hypothetical protein n=1 Tax=Oerskovia jenensis TaxID=162169 RepID=UPI0036DDAEA9
MSDGMPLATTGGVLVLATTGVQAGLTWMIAAAAVFVVAGAVMLRLRSRARRTSDAR